MLVSTPVPTTLPFPSPELTRPQCQQWQGGHLMYTCFSLKECV